MLIDVLLEISIGLPFSKSFSFSIPDPDRPNCFLPLDLTLRTVRGHLRKAPIKKQYLVTIVLSEAGTYTLRLNWAGTNHDVTHVSLGSEPAIVIRDDLVAKINALLASDGVQVEATTDECSDGTSFLVTALGAGMEFTLVVFAEPTAGDMTVSLEADNAPLAVFTVAETVNPKDTQVDISLTDAQTSVLPLSSKDPVFFSLVSQLDATPSDKEPLASGIAAITYNPTQV